jgi:hypothetical protein
LSVTITGARWANAESSRLLVITAERGSVLLKPEHPAWSAAMAWIAGGGVVTPFVAPTPQRRLSKADFVGRLTDDELATLAGLLTATNAARRRAMWVFLLTDELNPDAAGIRALLENLFGAARRDALLA